MTLEASEACCNRLAGVLFPWDITRALELALLKTFCLPSISALLAHTGLMVAELLRHGLDSAPGAAVIARMNRIHGHYAITNDDFLYVLSSFVAEPIRWLESYGWRGLTNEERDHLFRFWQAAGERMEQETFRYAASNQRIAEATPGMLLADWPAPLRPLLRRVLQSLLANEVAGSLGWPAAPGTLQRGVLLALRSRSRIAGGWLALRQRLGGEPSPRFYSMHPTPSYGRCFALEQLGPPPLLPQLAHR